MLATNLRRFRTERGWTQERAAERCGMIWQNYQELEAEGRNITLLTLVRLAIGFGVEVPALLVPAQPGAKSRP